MDEKKVKVRILPLHGIGGIGNAGDVAWINADAAAIYVREGYVEIVEPKPSPDPHPALPQIGEHDLGEEDHAIMKLEVKRAKKRK
jgi:hypothetical protein